MNSALLNCPFAIWAETGLNATNHDDYSAIGQQH